MELKENPSLLELTIKDFRAIKEATIKLDGITVVTGLNSTGKSTISALLYYIFDISNNYNNFVKEKFDEKMQNIMRMLANLTSYRFINELIDKKNLLSMQETVFFVIKEIQKHYGRWESYNNGDEIDDDGDYDVDYYAAADVYRVRRLIEANFSEYIPDIDIDTVTIEKILDVLQNIVEKIYDECQKEIKDRNKDLFERKLRNIYASTLEEFLVKEHGKNIISEEKRLEEFDFISHAIYIDSPMAVEHPKYTGKWGYKSTDIEPFRHWLKLDSYLKQEDRKQVEKIIDTDIYKEIQETFKSPEVLDGEIKLDKSSDKLMYHRNDGEIFKVENCATGIKSLAILQMLYKNGWLNNKTLLVLDEPETHLHPQWVVEYARLIVLLHKEVGVKFFISSHHPDMVDAIKYIVSKEDVGDTCRFYLAKKQSDYTYIFEDKGRDIEDIFGSFNIAIEKIDRYSADDDQ